MKLKKKLKIFHATVKSITRTGVKTLQQPTQWLVNALKQPTQWLVMLVLLLLCE